MKRTIDGKEYWIFGGITKNEGGLYHWKELDKSEIIDFIERYDFHSVTNSPDEARKWCIEKAAKTIGETEGKEGESYFRNLMDCASYI